MLSTVVRRPSALPAATIIFRSLTTETYSESSSHDVPPPPPPKRPLSTPRSLYPSPRRADANESHLVHAGLPNLPPRFGRNQLLPVSNSTRALMESIVGEFGAPIRYAFAYGSGVFEQDGYPAKVDGEAPMLDFMFAVTHAAHFHSINMQQHPGHYTLHAKMLGSSYVSNMQDIGPGVWFNAYIPMAGVTIKYGVTTVDNLCADLLNWRTLYLAGRMHKPLRIIKDDARVRLTQQVNLTSAVRAALLTLPPEFSETQLFERVAGISYRGDPRMLLPAENRGKVANMVRRQTPQFKELYYRLVVGLPGVHWPAHLGTIQQDTSPHARAAHLKKLPANLLGAVKRNYDRTGKTPAYEADESAYWVRLAGDERLAATIDAELKRIVRYAATIQSLKGVVSAGVGKSVRYGAAKVGKWWNGGRATS
ncbi:mitochondrial matrix Mmp37-domain-containing protein [Mycena pura]|uniref:Phosphatidate cytidylyltransferase, mitochondrial n=1 Tax=Mycena pura TaxID=153505 RepID=A0AAD6VGC3_9AGAR|nr:mitochondrial matrix Mmp37-domain-containing protein [Mycena pura]